MRDMSDRRLAYEITNRLDIKQSGNTGDAHFYLFLGGVTCCGVVWREVEEGHSGDFKQWREVWKSSNDNRVFPTFAQAVDFAIRGIGSIIESSKLTEEIEYAYRNRRGR